MSRKFSLPHFFILIKKKGKGYEAASGLRLVVTRKMRRAVDRNRVKRVVREFFRVKRPLLPEELVICRIVPTAAKIKNEELFQELNQVLSIIFVSLLGGAMSF